MEYIFLQVFGAFLIFATMLCSFLPEKYLKSLKLLIFRSALCGIALGMMAFGTFELHLSDPLPEIRNPDTQTFVKNPKVLAGSPARCNPTEGDFYYDTTYDAHYQCTAVNHWTDVRLLKSKTKN